MLESNETVHECGFCGNSLSMGAREAGPDSIINDYEEEEMDFQHGDETRAGRKLLP